MFLKILFSLAAFFSGWLLSILLAASMKKILSIQWRAFVAFFILPIALHVVAYEYPLKSNLFFLKKTEVTANFPFAGAIEVQSERVDCSTKLACFLWLQTETKDSVLVREKVTLLRRKLMLPNE